MNIRKIDIQRIVMSLRTMEKSLKEATICKEMIDEILRNTVQKDGKLNFMYEENNKG